MAKMVNPNSVSDMAVMNAKAQAKMTQLVQKLGRGKRRTVVTLSKSTRSYMLKMIEEMRKQMLPYEKQLPNVFQFFTYFEKEIKITKENKKEKTKDVLLSFEELDFLKLQLQETIKGIDNMKKTLKWFNFLKKLTYNFLKKQNEISLEELKNSKSK